MLILSIENTRRYYVDDVLMQYVTRWLTVGKVRHAERQSIHTVAALTAKPASGSNPQKENRRELMFSVWVQHSHTSSSIRQPKRKLKTPHVGRGEHYSAPTYIFFLKHIH
ncbi:MAG: hypothetical protein JWN75_638 [Candidatus Saccharibacteria bacterium]|nr:hypothetical protein [Candidatus Saccharibacteria bacterium]